MRKRIYAFATALICFGFTWFQADAQLNIFWEEVGPNNAGDHVRGLTVDANGVVWAGSVGGGLWKSTNQGASWNMVSGLDENLAVSSIAVDGNKIYVGTGETFFYEPDGDWISSSFWNYDSTATWRQGFHFFSGMPGQGVYVSTDGGTTWDHDNGTWNASSVDYEGNFVSIQKIASSGGITLIASLEGLYRSSSATLNTVTKANGTSAFEDNPIVDVEFLGNGVVLAATTDSLYRSTDNGANFGKAINDSLPNTFSAPNNRLGGERVEIAVAPSDPNTVYVTGASGINGNCTGVWRSTDAGINWERIAPYETATFKPFQNMGKYSLVMAVDPTNSNSLILGGVKLYKYDDNNGWEDAASHTYIPGFSTRYAPSPILSIAFDPTTDSTFYLGTDGEIVRTNDLGDTYSFKTKGFNNSHCMGVSAAPNYKVLASDRYQGILYKNNGNGSIGLQQFNDIYSNTGGGIARWSMTNPTYLVSQNTASSDLGLTRSLSNGATFETFYGFPKEPFHPSFGVDPDSMIVDRPDTATGGAGVYDSPGAPLVPWCFDEYIPAANLTNDTLIQNTPAWLYMCSKSFVWVCCNPFGTLDSVPFWNRLTHDLSKDDFGFGKKNYFTAIATSEDADHVVYVGMNNGKIFRINNANDPVNVDPDVDVVRIDTGQGMPDRWITDIEFDPSNTDNLIVTFGSYDKGDDRVFITNNAKAAMPTFRSIQGNLPADLPVYSAAFHPDPDQKSIVLGTDEGVYATSSNYEGAGSITWHDESTNVGKVPVNDVVFRKYFMSVIDADNYKYGKDYTLFIATNGRGVFKSTSMVAEDQATIVGSGIDFTLSPNPTNDFGKVEMDFPVVTRAMVEVFTLNGRKIETVTDKLYTPGNYDVSFDVRRFPAGIYLVKGTFSNKDGLFHETLKQVVVK